MISLASPIRQERFPATYPERQRAALRDFVDGFLAVHIWWQFGLHDVKQRYRRSVLGPFWLTISTGILVAALGFLYARILNQEVRDYLPFLAVGLIVWHFISTTISESCQAFIAADTLIKQVQAPMTVHVLRMLCRNFMIFLHQAIILILVAALSPPVTLLEVIWVPLGVLAIMVNMVWIALVLGPLCARFRDIPLIVQNIIQITFFVTPILWKPGVLGDRGWVADWNPVYHFIELVRAPILTGSVPTASWIFVLATSVVGFSIALPLFARTRGRIAYWV
jgi:ABC-type polysaccharide/polyol phosphate export permease